MENMFSAILVDIYVIIKLFFYCIYCYLYEIVKYCMSSDKKNKNVHGQVVLITGAAGGIGSNLVKLFFKQGCILVCLDRDKISLDRLKTELYILHSSEFSKDVLDQRILTYVVDISSTQQIKSFATKLKSTLQGRNVDILINNAGIVNNGKLLLDLEENEIRNLFEINVFAHFWICKEFLGDMIKQKRGHIVNVASACGLVGSYRLTDYCASKFAVVGFTESLRIELKMNDPKSNITVSTVCPFHVQTKLFEGVRFNRLSWLGLSMTPEFVSEQIFNGILTNKEMILIPSVQTSILNTVKHLVTTKFLDHALEKLDLARACDSLTKKL